jgi:hypothetical protein
MKASHEIYDLLDDVKARGKCSTSDHPKPGLPTALDEHMRVVTYVRILSTIDARCRAAS